MLKKIWIYRKKQYLCNPNIRETFREISSVGSERLPYKQRVGGSNPSSPTQEVSFIAGLYLFLSIIATLTWNG